MEHPGNEERGPSDPFPGLQQPPPSSTDTFIAVTASSNVIGGNGTVLSASSAKERPISGVVPPYWRHSRALSRASQTSTDTGPRGPVITLEDHTEDPNSDTSRGLWAKSVTIDDHVVVEGKTGVGAYVVWICRIQMLEGGPMMIRMRYSEFDELRNLLLKAFPHAKSALPPLPRKSVLFKFRPSFLESRRVGLQYFLNCVLLNPEFSGSPVLKDFLFSRLG